MRFPTYLLPGRVLQFIGGLLCAFGRRGEVIEHEGIHKMLVGKRHFLTDALSRQDQWAKKP